MILGTVQYPTRYIGLGEGVKKGLEYLSQHIHELENFKTGKYEIDGDNIFFEICESITTKPSEKFFEAHKKYIDIHINLSGEEWFGYAPVNQLKESTPYDITTDTAYYTGEGLYNQVPHGHFILFMPEDAHKCGIYFQDRGTVKSLVLKVKI